MQNKRNKIQELLLQLAVRMLAEKRLFTIAWLEPTIVATILYVTSISNASSTIKSFWTSGSRKKSPYTTMKLSFMFLLEDKCHGFGTARTSSFTCPWHIPSTRHLLSFIVTISRESAMLSVKRKLFIDVFTDLTATFDSN